MIIQDGNLGPNGGSGGGQQITELDAQTMQAAWASLVGQSMETDKAVEDPNQAPEVYVVAADPHKRAGGIGFLRYIGSDDC
jgi:excinuclease UvrABC ATPase subunit